MVTNPCRNGELADAETIMYMQGLQFSNYAQTLYNQAYIGFNSKLNVSGVPNLKNVKYDCMLTDTATTKTGWVYDSTNDYYIPNLEDEASGDTTHDPNSFTNVANAFDSDDDTYAEKAGVSISLGKTFSSKYVGSIRLKTEGSVKVSAPSSGGYSGSWSLYLQTYDGADWTNHTSLGGASFSGSIPGGGGTITVGSWSINNSSFPILIDADTQGLRLILSGSTNYGALTSSETKVYSFEYGSFMSTGTLIFQTTSLPTITDCIPTWNAEIDSENTLTVSISADGTNYEEVSDATIHRFTNTGTNLYVKFEIDRVDTTAVDKISEYAILTNVGAS